MKSFDSFFTDLTSDQRHYELCQMHYRDETIKAAAWKIYALLVADETLQLRPMSQNRQHLYNLLCKNPPDKKKIDWTAKALEKLETEKKEEWKPVSWEKRAEYLKQVQAEIDRVADEKRIRPLFSGEAETNGQFDPPKPKAKCAPSAPVEVILEHIDKVNTARRKFYLEKNPGASEEEIKEYLKKFEMI